MNAFIKASQKERRLAEKLLISKGITQYGFTEDDGHESHDGWYITSKNEKVCFEVKCRNNSSTKYRDTVLDIYKYNYMINQTIGTPVVFVFFTDDKVMIEKLDGKYEEVQFWAPKTTAVNSEKILKTQVKINITNANTYTFIQ